MFTRALRHARNRRRRLFGPVGVALALVAAPLLLLPAAANALDPGTPQVVLEDGINGCNGVRPTPGSENTHKRLDALFPSNFNPGGVVGYVIDYPVDPADVAGRTTFVITDCVFVNGNAVAKYSVSFVPNTEEFQLRFSVPIPAGTALGAQFCNYAKTTAAPSESQASNRKAGPACFTVGGGLRIEKRSGSTTGPLLPDASFSVVCDPAVELPPTIITGLDQSHTNPDGTVSASGLASDGTIAINGPSGTPCTVTETAAPAGYQGDSTPRNLVIPIGTSQTINVFVNRQFGSLRITKVADVPGTFLFSIDCSENSFDRTGVTASPGAPYTLEGIPTGTSCTVIEQSNALFSATVVPASGTLTIAPGINTVAFTNTRLRGDLVITKASDAAGTFLFDIDCSDNRFDRAGVPASPGEPYRLSGISTGTSCTVTEQGNPLFSSVVVPSDGTVEIGTGVNTVGFTNTAKSNGISIDKKVNGADTSEEAPLEVEVGSPLTYTVKITNSGLVPLSISELTDSLNADLAEDCEPAVDMMLDPNESITCSYTMTAANPGGASIIHNAASVEGLDVFERPAGPESDETFVHVLDPAIHLDKTGPASAHVGDSISYTLTVTNPGNTPLAITDFDDDVCDAAPALRTKQGADSPLDPGETWVFQCSRVVVAGDPDRLVNTATVTGMDRLETEVDSTDDVTTQILRPAIAITKTGTTTAHVGDAVVYTLVVTNSGNTPLSSVAVTDPRCDGPPVRATVDGDGLLSPGEAWTYHCRHVATAADGVSILNTARAEGTDPLGQSVNNTANHTAVLLHPAISIVKTASPELVAISGPVTYLYVVTNTGDAVLRDVVVTDDILGAIGSVGELAPGESITMAKTVQVDASTPPRNIGTAVGTDPLGQTVSANDDAVITVVLGAVLAQPELPRTGAPLQAQAWAALAMIQVGVMLTLAGRRRRIVRRAD